MHAKCDYLVNRSKVPTIVLIKFSGTQNVLKNYPVSSSDVNLSFGLYVHHSLVFCVILGRPMPQRGADCRVQGGICPVRQRWRWYDHNERVGNCDEISGSEPNRSRTPRYDQ